METGTIPRSHLMELLLDALAVQQGHMTEAEAVNRAMARVDSRDSQSSLPWTRHYRSERWR